MKIISSIIKYINDWFNPDPYRKYEKDIILNEDINNYGMEIVFIPKPTLEQQEEYYKRMKAGESSTVIADEHRNKYAKVFSQSEFLNKDERRK